MLEHGGNLREAKLRFGGHDWIDLSTGINPLGFPAPALSPDAWHRLPESNPALIEAAREYYSAPHMFPVSGTQAAIQALPQLRAPSRVAVAAPSYAEHSQHWARHGHTMRQVPFPMLGDVVATSDVLVVCNPNNPTGETIAPATLVDWATQLAARGGWLVVDEAFSDTTPSLSVASHVGLAGLIVLRSVGKFFGLAGLRLGFVAAWPMLLDELGDLLGPWTVSGPAQQVGLAALRDRSWQQATQQRLAHDGARLHSLLAEYGIPASGTPLYQWWPEPRAEECHEHMARRAIWVRLFRDAGRGIRIGLPACETHWHRLEHALKDWNSQ